MTKIKQTCILPRTTDLAKIAATLVASKTFLDLDDPNWHKKAVREAWNLYSASSNFLRTLENEYYVIRESKLEH